MKKHQKYSETSIYHDLTKLAKFVYNEFINAPSERRSFLMSRLNDYVTESIITFSHVFEETSDVNKKVKGIEHLSNLLMSINTEINTLTDLKLIPDTHALKLADEVIIPLQTQYEKYSNFTIKNMRADIG